MRESGVAPYRSAVSKKSRPRTLALAATAAIRALSASVLPSQAMVPMPSEGTSKEPMALRSVNAGLRPAAPSEGTCKEPMLLRSAKAGLRPIARALPLTESELTAKMCHIFASRNVLRSEPVLRCESLLFIRDVALIIACATKERPCVSSTRVTRERGLRGRVPTTV
eukprot:scaffold21720_cov126-Isochrysis_galbana.AAC.5